MCGKVSSSIPKLAIMEQVYVHWWQRHTHKSMLMHFIILHIKVAKRSSMTNWCCCVTKHKSVLMRTYATPHTQDNCYIQRLFTFLRLLSPALYKMFTSAKLLTPIMQFRYFRSRGQTTVAFLNVHTQEIIQQFNDKSLVTRQNQKNKF